jgi:hypothetical protein
LTVALASKPIRTDLRQNGLRTAHEKDTTIEPMTTASAASCWLPSPQEKPNTTTKQTGQVQPSSNIIKHPKLTKISLLKAVGADT